MKMIKLKKIILLVCLSALIYVFSLDGDFVFDDSEAIVKNADIKLETSIYSIFKNDFWGTSMKNNASHKSYRPLTTLSFRLNRFVSGDILNPFHFKITNLTFHLIVIVVIYYVLCNILHGEETKQYSHSIWRDVPFLSSVLYSVHPIHVEAVSGIVGRADILSALFFFLCILFFDKSIAKSKKNDNSMKDAFIKWYHFIVSLLFSTMAMLCKETGITVLIVCSIYDIFIIHKINTIKIMKCDSTKVKCTKKVNTICLISDNVKTFYSGAFSILHHYSDLILRQIILYLYLMVVIYARLWIMDFQGPTFQTTDNPAAFSDSFITRVATYNYLYFMNILILIWPQWLCFDWSMGCIPILKSMLDPRTVFILLFWSFFCGLVYRLALMSNHQRKWYIISCSILTLPFLPASNVLMPVGFVVAERILYTSSLGFCLLIVIGFQKLCNSFKQRLIQKILKASFLFLTAIFALRTIERSLLWRTEQELYTSAVGVCPANAKVHYNIAKNAGDRGDVSLAEIKYRVAIELHPAYYQAMNNLANLYKDQGKFVEAELLLREALDIKADFPAAWMNLGIVLANLKQHVASENAYKQALQYRRKYADCYYNLGNLYLELKKFELALSAWSEATNINPKHIVAWSNSLALLDNTGQVERGLLLAPRALQALPDAAPLHFNTANLYGKKSMFETAEMHFLKAIHLSRNNPHAMHFANLGVLYHRWKKIHKAMDMYNRALEIDPKLTSAAANILKLINRLNGQSYP